MTNAPTPNRTVMIVLAYLWPLALVPLVLDKQDVGVQWHAKHGIVLMVAELALLFAFMLFTSMAWLATLSAGCIVSLLGVFIWVGILAIHVVAIIKGVGGGRFIIPGISEFADRF